MGDCESKSYKVTRDTKSFMFRHYNDSSTDDFFVVFCIIKKVTEAIQKGAAAYDCKIVEGLQNYQSL